MILLPLRVQLAMSPVGGPPFGRGKDCSLKKANAVPVSMKQVDRERDPRVSRDLYQSTAESSFHSQADDTRPESMLSPCLRIAVLSKGAERSWGVQVSLSGLTNFKRLSKKLNVRMCGTGGFESCWYGEERFDTAKPSNSSDCDSLPGGGHIICRVP